MQKKNIFHNIINKKHSLASAVADPAKVLRGALFSQAPPAGDALFKANNSSRQGGFKVKLSWRLMDGVIS